MRKFFIVFFCLGLLTCNDGDIITLELDFEDTFQQCGELVFYKTKDDPSESLSIEFTSIDSLGTFLVVEPNGIYERDEIPVILNYRTYNTTLPNNYFCNDIPDSSVSIESDEQSGDNTTATIITKLVEDDNDGIPAELEDDNTDGDDDPSTNPTDTDGDGLPNYLDNDDDGDNVPTSAENPDPNNDDDVNDAQDTDMDGIPDYLDTDDDGDGILTRDEESETQDQDPTNDIDNAAEGPDYLNSMFSMSVPATAYREHSILQTYTISCEVRNIALPSITQTVLDFGTFTPSTGSGTITTRTVTPEFN